MSNDNAGGSIFNAPSNPSGDRSKYPEVGAIVVAIVRHWHTKGIRVVTLRYVHEGDCDWRTTDDNSELSYDWTVIKWEMIPKAWLDVSSI